MVTAINQEAMVTDSIEAGALDFIVKPFKPEQLAEVVAKHCSV
jgi:two-component system chemotaxis response regulator CheY